LYLDQAMINTVIVKMSTIFNTRKLWFWSVTFRW